MMLHGKTALITGAGRGIGKGCAIELAKAGANLIINDRPSNHDIAATYKAVTALGAKAQVVQADAFTRGGCEELINEALRRTEQIDILISNPAYGVRCRFLDFDPREFELVVASTLTAGFHISQLVARQMVERQIPGKILFISSVQAEMPFANSVAYGAAKCGLNHMARTIAVELAGHRINVNVIEPGWIDTPGERLTFGEETIRLEANKLPWGRLGTETDIGRAAVFLVSDSADYITGTVLCVDGGFRFKDCGADRQVNTLDRTEPPTSGGKSNV